MTPGNHKPSSRAETFSLRSLTPSLLLCCALAAGGCGLQEDLGDHVVQSSTRDLVLTTCALAQGYAAVRYLDPAGADVTAHDGSAGLPWKSLTYALGRMQAREMLCVRPGTYPAKAEHLLRYDNTGHHTMVWVANRSGTSALPLLVRGSDPRHKPVFTLEDERLAQATWRRVPRAALPAPSQGTDIGRTVYVTSYDPIFPCAANTPQCRAMGGYVHVTRNGRTERLPLIPYTDRASFMATTQRQRHHNNVSGKQLPVYIGPGLLYEAGANNAPGKLYIRLDNTHAMGDQGHSVGTNPNLLRLELWRTSDAYHFIQVSHMTLQDLSFVGRVWFYSNSLATIPRGITLRRTTHRGFVAKRSLVEIHATGARVEGALIDGGFPPWIYRSDVKTTVRPSSGDPHGPAWSFHGANLVLQGTNIKVQNSRIRNAFMGLQLGVLSLATTNITVRQNVIQDVNNDAIIMLSNAYNVDISRNLLLDCFAGVTTTGTLRPLVEGRVNVHHNIISLGSVLCGRDTAPGHIRQYTTYPATDSDDDGRCENRAFGLHSTGQGEGINIYNNTIVASTAHHSGALGIHLRATSVQPNYVYKNIVIQGEAAGRFSERLRANDGVSIPQGASSARAGTTVADGNLYWRAPRTCGAGQSSQPMFGGYMINRYHQLDWGVCNFAGYRQQSLRDLAELRSSAFAAASARAGYYSGYEQRSRFGAPRLTPGLRPLSTSLALVPRGLPANVLPKQPSAYTGACPRLASPLVRDACSLLARERRFSLPPRITASLAARSCFRQRLVPAAVDSDDARFVPGRRARTAGRLKALQVNSGVCPAAARAMSDGQGRRFCLFFSQQARQSAGRAVFSSLRTGATVGLLLSGPARSCPTSSMTVRDMVGGLTLCAYTDIKIGANLRGLRPEYSPFHGYIGYSWRVQ